MNITPNATMKSISLKIRREMSKKERKSLAQTIEENRRELRKKRYAPPKDYTKTRGWAKSNQNVK